MLILPENSKDPTQTTLWKTSHHKAKNTHHTKILRLEDSTHATVIPPTSLSMATWLPTQHMNCPRRHLARYTWSDNKVRKLAIVCLPWQHWTKALVWL
jgi:hypothetical protein